MSTTPSIENERRTDLKEVSVPPRRSFGGEELPVFCEVCGYHLHGLPAVKCEHCAVLHLRCPECGHTQPVNSLRPAMQQWLGRVRAQGLMLLVIAKVLFVSLLLVIWYPIGYEELGRYRGGPSLFDDVLRADEELGILIYAVACGLILRFASLRFSRGWLVGLVAGFLACLSMYLGFVGRTYYYRQYSQQAQTSLSVDLLLMVLAAHAIAAALCWPAWVLAVKILLPQRAGERLLEWQEANHRGGAPKGTTVEAEFGRQ